MSSTQAVFSGQAMRVIAGENRATAFLDSLRAGTARSDELALIVAALYGPELRGFCRVLVKALEVRNAA